MNADEIKNLIERMRVLVDRKRTMSMNNRHLVEVDDLAALVSLAEASVPVTVKVGEAYAANPFGDAPHGWIQWKGTDVCMDFRCSCGVSTHLDADFAYAIECDACGATYEMNPHVLAHPINVEQWKGCEPKRTER